MVRKFSQGHVEKVFEEEGCELLDTYVNNYSLMNFKCSCGNLGRTSFKGFRDGVRCRECRISRLKEKNKADTKKFIEELRREIYGTK